MNLERTVYDMNKKAHIIKEIGETVLPENSAFETILPDNKTADDIGYDIEKSLQTRTRIVQSNGKSFIKAIVE
ncbi:MAG TPA: hypothetical protein DEG06_10015 [Lachnospiraceae bacterium]|nr:hypothetical protein [Lachnospiraceae bacterium]